MYIIKSYTEAQKRAILKYYHANKEKIVKKQMERAKERYHNDTEFREKSVIRMREAMRKKKVAKTQPQEIHSTELNVLREHAHEIPPKNV